MLRTQDGINPVFASVGHLIDLRAAQQIVLACTIRYRLPKPTRLADQLVGAAKRAMGLHDQGSFVRSLAPYTAHFRAEMDALKVKESPRIDQQRERSLTYAGPTPQRCAHDGGGGPHPCEESSARPSR